MATLLVEGVPSALLARLADLAAANGRCLNSEVILSLVRHLSAQHPSRRPQPRAGLAHGFGPPVRPEGRAHRDVPWGEPT